MTSTQAPATGTCELCSRPTTNLQQFVLVFVDTFEQSTVSTDVKTTNYTLFRTASAQSMLPVFTRSTQTLQVMTPDEWEAVRHAAEMQRLGR
jgi:hypothetical protein